MLVVEAVVEAVKVVVREHAIISVVVLVEITVPIKVIIMQKPN